MLCTRPNGCFVLVLTRLTRSFSFRLRQGPDALCHIRGPPDTVRRHCTINLTTGLALALPSPFSVDLLQFIFMRHLGGVLASRLLLLASPILLPGRLFSLMSVEASLHGVVLLKSRPFHASCSCRLQHGHNSFTAPTHKCSGLKVKPAHKGLHRHENICRARVN